MAEVGRPGGKPVTQVWGWVTITGAVVLGLLAYGLVFRFATSSDGYSCGTLLHPNAFGGRATYGDGGCGYRFREGWTAVLVLLSAAAILASLGVGLVVRARSKRR